VAEDTVILAEDEALLKFEATMASVWYPKGEQPEILVTGERKRKSFYGAIDVKTGKEQVYVCDRQNQGETIILLDQLKKVYLGRKILLFWDNAPWHRGKKIKRYLRKNKDLELVPFPAYSPDLNPQEHVWKEARRNVSHNHESEDFEELVSAFQNYLTTTTFSCNFLEKYKV